MSNVVNFNSTKKNKNKKKKEQVEDKLNSYIEALSAIYGHITDVEDGLDRMNYEGAKIEEVYEQALKEYANLVGKDNVPQEFLEYSMKAEVVDTGDSLTLKFRDDEGE